MGRLEMIRTRWESEWETPYAGIASEDIDYLLRIAEAARAVDNTFNAERAELEHLHAMYVPTELLLSLRAALSGQVDGQHSMLGGKNVAPDSTRPLA